MTVLSSKVYCWLCLVPPMGFFPGPKVSLQDSSRPGQPPGQLQTRSASRTDPDQVSLQDSFRPGQPPGQLQTRSASRTAPDQVSLQDSSRQVQGRVPARLWWRSSHLQGIYQGSLSPLQASSMVFL